MSQTLRPDDASADYTAYRQAAQADATVQEFLRGREAKAAKAPAGQPAEPRDSLQAGQDTISGAEPPAAASPRLEAPPENPATAGIFSDKERFLAQAREDTGRGRLLGVVGDVGRGIIEAPRQFIGGVSDAVHNTFMAADSLGDWLNENVVDLTFPIPNTGIAAVDQLIQEPAKAFAGQKDEVSRGESVTGGIVREAARFLTGFKAAGKMLGTAGATGFTALPAGAIADFVAQDPDAGRLADLWGKMGLPENELIAYLESDPNDSELEKRFKNALEGAGIGALTEGVFRAFKYIRAKWIAGSQATPADLQAADTLAVQPRVRPESLAPLGDVSPDAPLVRIESADEVAARLAKAADVTETGVPEGVVAKGVAGAAKDAAEGIPEFLRGVNVDDLNYSNGLQEIAEKAGVRAGTGIHRSEVIAAIKEKYPALSQPISATSGLVDTRGSGARFHGTSAEIKNLEEFTYSSQNIFGQGLYTTDAADAAAGYLKKGDGASPTLYSVAEVGAPKMFDLEVPMNAEFVRAVRNAADDTTFGWALDEIDGAATPRQWIDEVRARGASEGASADTVQELFDGVRANLEKDGYRGYRHVGGAATSTAAHDVKIYWFPKDDVKLEKVDVSDLRVPVAENAPSAGRQTIGEPQITINFARMDTPDDLQQVFRDTAEAFSGSIDEARRGAISLEETAKMAERLGMTPEQLIARHRGEAFNAEQIKAAGVVMDSATQKLFELAERAAAPTASQVDQFMFRKMLAVHHAIQAEFLGVVAEAGRALNAVKIAQSGGTAEMGRAITSMVEGFGGSDVGQALAQRLVMLSQSGAQEAALNQFVRKSAFATTMDAVKTFWINALLSNPTTHIVNTASNSMVITQQVYERMVAEGISGALGRAPGQGVAPGEAAAMLYGLTTSMQDAFRLSWRALKTGESQMASQLGKVDLPRTFNRGATRAISSTAFGLDEAGAVGRTVDLMGAVTEAPGRLLLTEDEFFKSIGYRMELAAQAFRQAAGEGLQDDTFWSAVADYMNDPPEALRLAAADAALYNTFTNSTEWFGRHISQLRSAGGSANPITFIIPFVRTPVNIARYAFERSPAAPLVRQWRADIAAGGARADLALARMGTGTTIMFLASDLAMQGIVSGRGPKDQGEREAMIRQGWQPYSIKVGDRWYSYNRMDPFGMTMGFAADFTEALNRGEVDPEDVDEWQEVMGAMIAAVGQVSVSKTYARGMLEFFEMMSDPQRYGPSYVNRFLGSFVPAGIAGAERLVDPTMREADNPYDMIVSRLPGLSDRLTPRRDLWGEEVKPDSGLGPIYDTFSPVYARRIKESPADAEIQRLNADVRRIKKRTSFQGVDVNFRDWPEVYDAYVKLAGNELKHPAWGLGAKDFLDEVVSGKHDLSEIYNLRSDGKDGGKAEYIRSVVRQYREMAQREIMSDPRFEDFQRYVARKTSEKRQKRAPAGMGVVLQ